MVAAAVAVLDPGGDDHGGSGEHGDAAELPERRREACDGLAGEMAAGGLLGLVENADRRTAARSASRACIRAFLPTDTTTRGGSSEPDMNALAVIAWGERRGPVDRTITPVAKRPRARPEHAVVEAARHQRNALSPAVLTRSFAFQPSRSYSAMHDSANCFQRSYWPEARAPNRA